MTLPSVAPRPRPRPLQLRTGAPAAGRRLPRSNFFFELLLHPVSSAVGQPAETGGGAGSCRACRRLRRRGRGRGRGRGRRRPRGRRPSGRGSWCRARGPPCPRRGRGRPGRRGRQGRPGRGGGARLRVALRGAQRGPRVPLRGPRRGQRRGARSWFRARWGQHRDARSWFRARRGQRRPRGARAPLAPPGANEREGGPRSSRRLRRATSGFSTRRGPGGTRKNSGRT